MHSFSREERSRAARQQTQQRAPWSSHGNKVPPPPYKQGTPSIELGLISKGSHWDYAIFRFNRSNISIQ